MEARTDRSAQDIAQACADTMWQDDRASKALGMSIVRIARGEAVLSMPIRKDMTNGHDICHGGFMFTLADSAFAFACNTYNQRTVAQQCAVTFLRPVTAGETGENAMYTNRPKLAKIAEDGTKIV